MSNNNLDQVLLSLETTQDPSKLLKLLTIIRKEVDWPTDKDNINKLREKGSLKFIIESLQTGKKSIIDLSLSILGNCCLDSKCSRNVVSRYNILSNLNQILKRFPTEDSINGRIFRVIGNLCQHKDQLENVIIDKKPQIIIHTVKYLKDVVLNEDADAKVSEATIIMAVRALRELLNNESIKTLVKTYEVLKAIGLVLIKYGTIWEETKKNQSILINIIKLLVQYSRYKYYPSITELRNTERGDSIICLSKILLICPHQIVKIITNFLKICQLKSDLPIPEIFDSIISILRSDNSIENLNGSYEECIKCICQLLDHPGNRNNERCGESIPLLIDVLNDSNHNQNNINDECSVLIISTLNKCKYNPSLISDQIKGNAISVLTEKLKSIIGPVEPFSISHESDRKRKAHFISQWAKESKKLRRTLQYCFVQDDRDFSSSSDEEMEDFAYKSRCDWSPASSSDSELAMSWTSGLSPRASPQSQMCEFSESDSDDYSPVCSEVDPTDFPFTKTDNDDDDNAPHTDHDMNVEEDNEPVEEVQRDVAVVKHVKIKLVLEIVDLLKTYSRVRPAVAQLGSCEVLKALIKSCCFFDFPVSSNLFEILEVVYKILDQYDYLLPLIQTDFLRSMHNLSVMQHGGWCLKCCNFQQIGRTVTKKISRLAESDAGKGDIVHKWLRGGHETKQRLVLAIPYIIRNPSLLVKLMISYGGLEILLKLLEEQTAVKENCIQVLYVLASERLKIVNPKNNLYTNRDFSIQAIESKTDDENAVTFLLDDSSRIKANKVTLSEQSDFFERLLHGDFKESKEDEIVLQNVDSSSLKCLLQLMSYDFDKTVPINISIDLGTLLDVIALCDRFLMPNYCHFLTDCVEKFKLSAKNIPVIYQWSIESKTNLLRIECVAFALVDTMVHSERVRMFNVLFELGYNREMIDDISTLLTRYFSANN